MLEPQPKYIKAPGYRLNASTQDKNFIKRQNKFHKSKTLKDEMPDALYNSNSIVKQSEKLSNVRRSKKRMTQLEKNIDLPDTLLGFNEYKENKIHKDTRVRKMLRSESLHPDLPDILEPINEIITSTMPKPYVIKEESKNQEISENDYNKEEFIKEEKKEDEIIENNNIEEKKVEITEERLEELKKLEIEKQKLEEEKKKLEEQKKFDEEQKRLDEEKRLEEQ